MSSMQEVLQRLAFSFFQKCDYHKLLKPFIFEKYDPVYCFMFHTSFDLISFAACNRDNSLKFPL